MANEPKTKFARGKSPFEKRPNQMVDLSIIEKCNDPYIPNQRIQQQHKYDKLFDGAKVGDCFRIRGDAMAVSATAKALRAYFRRRGKEAVIRQQTKSDDGIGRVYVLAVNDKVKKT